MTNLRTLLAASFALTLAGFSAAQADTFAGSWKIAVGNGAGCPITLADDGSATYAGDCADTQVAHWRAKSTGVELLTAAHTSIAILTKKDASYTGKRFVDNRSLTLTH